jgi:CubicO group peptidase (beta-lactamase class C family)
MVLYASLVGAAMAEVAAQPEPRLEAAAPETVGVDSAPLMTMSEWLKDRLDVRSLRIVKDGKLIFERYSSDLTRDHNYELYSVTKTITALTFGVLAGQGKIASSERITPWILKAHPEFEDALSDTDARRTDYPVAMARPTCHCGLAHSSCAT